MNIEDLRVDMACTCFACPQQYEGTVDGNPAYFRLRHSAWRFSIVKPGENPIFPQNPENVLYYKDGALEGDDVGIMEDAPAFILSMVKEFRESGNPGKKEKA